MNRRTLLKAPALAVLPKAPKPQSKLVWSEFKDGKWVFMGYAHDRGVGPAGCRCPWCEQERRERRLAKAGWVASAGV